MFKPQYDLALTELPDGVRLTFGKRPTDQMARSVWWVRRMLLLEDDYHYSDPVIKNEYEIKFKKVYDAQAILKEIAKLFNEDYKMVVAIYYYPTCYDKEILLKPEVPDILSESIN